MLSCRTEARSILLRDGLGRIDRGIPFVPQRMTPETDLPDNDDRRSNLVLRALIDEMLERVREVNRMSGVWSTGERARAEAELEAIMARVRRVASKNQAP